MKQLLFSLFVLVSFSLSAQTKPATAAPVKEMAKEISNTVPAAAVATPTPVGARLVSYHTQRLSMTSQCDTKTLDR